MADNQCGTCSGCVNTGSTRYCEPCCAVGRPFLVAGTARCAELVARADWLAGDVRPDLAGLGPEARRALGEAWQGAAAMEHASIAAFARFVLELMSLGAPAELIDESTRAMSDESEHAKLCFSLASTYLGVCRGPGPLETQDSLLGRDLHAIVITALREGCIGETVAALEAAEALEHATDEAVRRVLERISVDEMRHAALAWRFVRWALSNAELGLRQAVRAELDAALTENDLARPRAPEPADANLLAHGILPEAHRRELRWHVVRDLIGPCATALFEPAVGAPADARDHGLVQTMRTPRDLFNALTP